MPHDPPESLEVSRRRFFGQGGLCLGSMDLDHERLTYRYQGRDYRLTDVHGKVVRGVLA